MSRRRRITEDELADLAEEIARDLPAGANIYLSGELGAGKTTFSRALLQALRSQTPATSPTFSLLNYHRLDDGRSAIHADLYRLTDADDAVSIGLLEHLSDPQTVVLVEWPERAMPVLPAPTIHLHFAHHTPTTRIVSWL